MFEQLRQNSGEETNRMLNRLERRVNTQAISQVPAEKIIGQLNKALEMVKKIPLNSLNSKEIADLTNPWIVWKKDSLFITWGGDVIQNELKTLLSERPDDPSLARFARQLWRTEMVSHVIKNILNHPKKAEVMVQVLETQEVQGKETTPEGALLTASIIDTTLNSAPTRTQIAKLMNKGKDKDWRDIITIKDWNVRSLKIVIGGELVNFPLTHVTQFQFRNAVQVGNRIYGQMKNGCKGNLVIIELEKSTAPPALPASVEPHESESDLISNATELLDQFAKTTPGAIMEGPFIGEQSFNYRIRHFLLTDLKTLHSQEHAKQKRVAVEKLLESGGLRKFSDEIFKMEMSMRGLKNKLEKIPHPQQLKIKNTIDKLQIAINLAQSIIRVLEQLELYLIALQEALMPRREREKLPAHPRELQEYINQLSKITDELNDLYVLIKIVE